MLDDSWDSTASPDVKKKVGGLGTRNNKSNKYDFPSPAGKRGGSLEASQEFDADLLFSPTNSQGSPAATPGDYRNKSYNFDDSPKKTTSDYLSNFVLESNDLEDSILGGLLGGGARKSAPQPVARQRSPQPKLDPLETSDSSPAVRTRISPRRSNSSPPKSQIFRPTSFRGSSPADMEISTNDFDADDDFPISPAFGVKPQSQASVTFKAPAASFDAPMLSGLSSGKGRLAQPSFDVSQDPGFLEELTKPEDMKPPAPRRFTDGLVRPSTSHGLSEALPPAVPASKLTTTPRETFTPRDSFFPAAASVPAPIAALPAATSPDSAGDNDSKDKDQDKEEEPTRGLAFIPSFMEPGRQTRRRRQLGTSPDQGDSESGSGPGSVPKLSELDIALGLGGPVSVPKKEVVDPFSAVDKKIPQLEKQASAAFQMDSDDSSSDDALFNPNRYGRKDTFTSFSKPPASTSGAQGARGGMGGGKDVNQAGSTAFPAPPGASGATTAPARVSTFTPSKPGAPAGGNDMSPAPIIGQPSASAAEATGPVRMHMAGASTASAPGPAHGMKMSDSFDDASPVKSPVSPKDAHGGAGGGGSLPQISPVASFRTAGNASNPLAAAAAKDRERDRDRRNEKEDVPPKNDDDSDLDELDISGIVRVNLDDDLLIPRRSGALKSPASSSARPRTARSPRSSFANTEPATSGASRPSTAPSDTVPASARTNSPAAGALASHDTTSSSRRNSAVGATEAENAHSRRNSATHLANPSATAYRTAGSFSNGPTYTTSLDPPVAARRGTKEDLLSIMEDAEDRGRDRPYRGGSGDGVRTVTGADFNSGPAPSSDAVVRQLSAERTELESKLLKEIEELKVKLTHPQPASYRHAQLEATSEEREHYRLLQDSNIKYVQEVIDQKRIIAQLESEIARLKDEAIIKVRHTQDEMLWMKEKYESEIKDIKIKNSIETEALERRHEDSLDSLKKLHSHEIEAIKERYRSEEKFELIAGQLRTTSGSIQFIEQALQTRQRGVEALREGQMDARERLLQDLEAKARERAEIAEAEGYRLKGILSHMESVVSSLREQGNEEKERLRQEHARLQARQTSFEAERTAQQNRNLEELAYIKQRSKEVELELVKLTQEKQRTFEVIAEAQRKLGSEKAEFEVFLSSSKRSLEASEARLRDEDQRVARARNEVMQEKTALEERRLAAMKDIETAEELKNVLTRAQQEIETEKAELRRISQDYKAATEEIALQQQALREQQESLDEREVALREGFAQMKLAATELAQRERAVAESMQVLERKRLAVDRADRESMEQRLVSAASFREWSMRQGAELALIPAHLRSSRDSAPGTAWGPKSSEDPEGWGAATTAEDVFNRYDFNATAVTRGSAPSTRYPSQRFVSNSAEFDAGKENLYAHILAKQQTEKPWIELFHEQLQHAFQSGAGPGSGGAEFASGAQRDRLPPEVRSAQSMLRQTRAQLAKVTSSSLNTQRMLTQEGEFISALQAAKTPIAAPL